MTLPPMPEIQAFRGWRYNLAHVGDLSGVVAPPYDVIDADLQTALYKKHPCNVVRLILNRPEPRDEHPDVRYERAARFLRQWKNEGVLIEEGEPALYGYHQVFDLQGRTYIRKGFMARVRLEPFGQGSVFPHEETMSGPKEDRLKVLRTTGANLSPIFALYPDPEGEVSQFLEEAITGQTPLQATDPWGVTHRFWPISQNKTISAVAGLMGPKPLFIADGHHRYETAVTYRDDLQTQGALSGPDDPANFVLMTLISMSDPGLVILPTHRLVSGLGSLTADQLREALGADFECEPMGEGPESAHATWEWMQADSHPELLGLGTVADGRWQVARLRHPEAMRHVAAQHSTTWQRLSVSILEELILDRLHEREEPPAGPGTELQARVIPLKKRYVHQVAEVQQAVAERECDLACLVQAVRVAQLREIAARQEKLPPKSTYFYPKLLSGLVIHSLR